MLGVAPADGNGCHPIRAERENRCLTQKQLAQKAKVSVRTICTIEHGGSFTQYQIRQRILRALGLPWERHRDFFELRSSQK